MGGNQKTVTLATRMDYFLKRHVHTILSQIKIPPFKPAFLKVTPETVDPHIPATANSHYCAKCGRAQENQVQP